MDEKKTVKNIIIWIIFSLILSMLPLFDSAIQIYLNNLHHEMSQTWIAIIKSVVSHGELYLITLSTLGVGVGELFKGDFKWTMGRVFIIGGSFIVFYFSTSNFTRFSITHNQLDNSFIFHSSMFLLCSAIILTLSSFLIHKTKVIKEKE